MAKQIKTKRGRPTIPVNFNFGKNPFTVVQVLNRHNKSKKNTKLTRVAVYAKITRAIKGRQMREVKDARLHPNGQRSHPTYRYQLTPLGRKALAV